MRSVLIKIAYVGQETKRSRTDINHEDFYFNYGITLSRKLYSHMIKLFPSFFFTNLTTHGIFKLSQLFILGIL